MASKKKSTSLDPKATRLKLGLNQAQFWTPLGVGQSGGSRYESGRAMPKPVQKLFAIKYGTEAQRNPLLADLAPL